MKQALLCLMALWNGLAGCFSQLNQQDYYVYLEKNAAIPVVSVACNKILVETEEGIQKFCTKYLLAGADIVQARQIPDCAVIRVNNKQKTEIRVRFVPDSDAWVSAGGQTIRRPADEKADAWDGDAHGPERPYLHDYSQTLTMKIFVAAPDPDNPEGSLVNLRFDEVLEKIKEIDALTLGIPKIIYLVGWQNRGHDDRYPTIDTVNPFLACSTDAREDLRFLMREARKYNTVVSLHINSTDIYQNSPDWDLYRKNDLVGTKDGQEFVTGTWNGIDACQVVYKNLWESGFYKKWVDDLLELLPELRAGGTVHSDAFGCRPSDQSTMEQEWAARRQMIRYWRDCGLDLTTECMSSGSAGEGWEAPNGNSVSPTGLVGLVPYVWHLWQDEAFWHSRPASLLAGGGVPHTERMDWADLSRGNQAIAFLYGRSMQGEDVISKVPDWSERFLGQFCTTTLLYAWQNQFANVSVTGSGDECTLTKEADLVAQYSAVPADRTIRKDGILIRQDGDVFAPVMWMEGFPAVAAYSGDGYASRTWTFLPEWNGISAVDIYSITVDGPQLLVSGAAIPAQRTIDLTLAPNQAVLIVPAGKSLLV